MIAASSALLSVRDLRVKFNTSLGDVQVLDGVSFDVHAGRTLAILGESGSGKSVTAQAIMALLPKPSGEINGGHILFNGRDLASEPTKRVRPLCGTEISMIFQDPLSSLNPVFRIGAQVAEPFRRRLKLGRKESWAKALELLKRVGIPDAERRISDYPHQFSGGQRQRIMIAIAIALNPKVLIADEPTTALDVTVQKQIMSLLADLQSEYNMGLLLITHDLGVVADVADRTALMYSGRIVETGEIRGVYDTPAHPYSKGLLESIPSINARESRLTPIPGSPPSLMDVPPGCPFSPRCAFAIDRCRDAVPPLRNPAGWGPEHYAACIRSEEVLHHG